MELVTEPDLRDGEDAASFVQELQFILCEIGTCDGRMQGLSVLKYKLLFTPQFMWYQSSFIHNTSLQL